ncbi:MAG: hypothetical protein A2Z37_07780 [Chloroflexi bacterium RBG_19FT_COMBO_62_14]|nr:MAG: hypothetical protein A2Z37_07780 [Chloroflexi bacterium RBG_19FT_COMBO_62_14]
MASNELPKDLFVEDEDGRSVTAAKRVLDVIQLAFPEEDRRTGLGQVATVGAPANIGPGSRQVDLERSGPLLG